MNSVFARRQLEKHGWTDGDGLGRKMHGMSQPIKVNLKMDKTGVGHDPGKEFTDHWWMRAFNDAAKKTKRADEPEEKEESEESKRKAEMSAKRKSFYKGFVKGSTLTNGCETKDSDQSSSDDEETEGTDKTSVPTLDDLHKFCGGATGHRAARFGIKMKGKLSRVAAHDEEFEQQSKLEPGILHVKKGKHKNSKKLPSSDTQALDRDAEVTPNASNGNQCTEKETHESSEALLEALSETEKKKKKKKRKREKDDEELDIAVGNAALNLIPESELNEGTGKKRKKKRKADTLAEETVMSDSAGKGEMEDGGNSENDKPNDHESEGQEKPGSKKKKKKVKDQDEVLPTVDIVDMESERKEKRKKRRKRKEEEGCVSEENTNVVNESNLVDNVQINDSDELNGSGNKEKCNTVDVEIPRKKKKKVQDSDLNCEDIGLSVSNDNSDKPSKKKQSKSKKPKEEVNVPEHGISEETVVKKKKKKKNKDCI